MDAFWAKGYEATSMADLCNCTGLHKGSLYQAFGDKHSLFMNALHHYADSEFHETTEVAFKLESPLERIRAVVGKICEDASSDKGCMMINSMVELAPPETIAQAQALGEIKVKTDPYKLARQLMMTLAGGAAMVKGLLEPHEINEAAEDLIDSWV